MRSFGLILLASLAMGSGAHAITVTNGSFEQGAAITGGFDLLSAGNNTSITGWTVLGPGGVDYIDNSLWGASDGARSVELLGVSPGGVEQVITNQFVVGQKYIMRFDLSANPFAFDGQYGATVSVTGAAAVGYNYLKTAANTPTRPRRSPLSAMAMARSASCSTMCRSSKPACRSRPVGPCCWQALG